MGTLIQIVICLLPTFHQKRTSNNKNLPTTDFVVLLLSLEALDC